MFEKYIFPILLLAGTGLFASVMLAVAAKFMAVKVDEKLSAIREALPGANCGACGCAGCDDYAKKLLDGAATNLCTPGGDAVSHKISEILGVDFKDVAEKYAVVRCNSDCAESGYLMDYKGHESCSAASLYYGGRAKCRHSCMGFGDCVAVCQYGAIKIVDGVAVIDKMKCAGCGMCERACPKHIIEIIPYSDDVFVACQSTEKGGVTRKQCTHGCIGCKKCEKVCPNGAITVVDNLARVDYDKCTSCGLCLEACPTHVIKSCIVPKIKTTEKVPEPTENQEA